jgi:hypothetical protein
MISFGKGIALVISLFFCSCMSNTSEKSDNLAPVNNNVYVYSGNYEDDWEHFKRSILTDDTDFDWMKFANTDYETALEYSNMFEDDYTRSILSETTYEQLEEEIIKGVTVKKMHVVVSDGMGNMMGYTYMFAETSMGLEFYGYDSF